MTRRRTRLPGQAKKRNYEDPLYKKWRQAVRARDGNKCRWPGCGSRSKLHVHHIIRWAESIFLRYTVANGITLCSKHHKLVTGKELEYAYFLKQQLWKSL